MEDQLLPLLRSQNLPEELCEKFVMIFGSGAAVHEHLKELSEEQRNLLENAAAAWQYSLLQKLREIEYLLMRVTNYGDNDITYEYNHSVIKAFIDRYMDEYKRMPSLRKIAEETGISRKTISKHMAEAGAKEEERLNEYNYMAKDVLSTMLYKARAEGDTKAAKLYLDSMNKLLTRISKAGVVDLNGFMLSQEKADMMSYEQREMMIDIWTKTKL